MNRINQVYFLLRSLLAAGPGLAEQPAPVRVEQWLLQGTVEEGPTVRRGIPFAAPPVGELRWCAPQPVAKWDGVRKTVHFAPDPYQGDGSAAMIAPQPRMTSETKSRDI